MAFDQPLEADRVDDLNLFSSFVRAPIIGTIMWLLGGDAAKKQEEEQRRQDTAAAMIVEGANSDALSSSSNKCTSKARLRRSSLKKAPHLIGSEVSELGELSDPLGNEAAATALPDLHLQRSTGSSSSSGSAVSLKRQRRKKQLSWSDETGHDLAMFLGVKESSRNRSAAVAVAALEASQSVSNDTPSPMTRSRSVQANANGLGASSPRDETTRYLPKAFNRSHNGVNMPTMPYGTTSSGASGIESPQWGWYVKTTPPTPEMYQSRPMHKKQISSADASQASTNTTLSESSTATASQPNRVFQDLQERRHGNPYGWPGVPF